MKAAIDPTFSGAVALLALGVSATTQQWSLRSATPEPPAHVLGMAYDAARGVTVACARSASGLALETWEWDGAPGAWSLVSTPSQPQRQYTLSAETMAVVWDSVRREVLLIGAADAQVRSATLSAFDGTDWREVAAPAAPPWSLGVAAAFDEARGVLVAFFHGGTAPGLWEWDGTSWQQRTPAGPPPREGAALAYDPLRGVTVLAGGTTGRFRYDADTWEWNGTAWTRVVGAGLLRDGHAMAFATARGRVVACAGQQTVSNLWTVYGDLREWDGQSWSVVSPFGPSPRVAPGLAFDVARGRLVMFGGAVPSGGTDLGCWEFTHPNAATVAPIGSGCAGSGGVPSIDLWRGRLGWPGATLELVLRNLPPAAPAAIAFGASRTAWAGGMLPFDLTPAGMPGCALRVSADLVVFVTNTGGTSIWSQPVPASPSLVGTGLHGQPVVLEPGANAAGVVLGDAVTCTIGLR